MKSLADALGVTDPQKTEPQASPLLSLNLSAEEFARRVLDSVTYRDSLLRRILMDELPAQVECLLYHYAHGKPVERVEVKDTTTDVDEMNVDQCENEAMRLLELARQLRAESSVAATDETNASIH